MQKHQIGNILLSCVMGVALFSGCNIETSSISTQATPSSSTQIRENSKNSLDYNAMKAHYLFIQFAHTIRQLLENGNLLTKSLKLKIKEVSHFLLDTLTSTISDLNNIETNFQLRFDD